MLEWVFREADDQAYVDGEGLLAVTDWDFVSPIMTRIGEQPIKDVSFGGDRRATFVYFEAAGKHYSFAWDKKMKQLIFSEQLKKKWKFVVGWKVVS